MPSCGPRIWEECCWPWRFCSPQQGRPPPSEELGKTRIEVAGLRAGTRIKVLFEDREIVAAAGHFFDDFRGRDLYQRFGGSPGSAYGPEPVALHIYEIP